MTYRRFPVVLQNAILRRASDESGRVYCERCGLRIKSRAEYEIDHVIAEAMRPEEDKRRLLTMADGQLLCKANCHRGDKTPKDVRAIAKAKRIETKHVGFAAKGKRQAKPPLTKIAQGKTRIARQYGL